MKSQEKFFIVYTHANAYIILMSDRFLLVVSFASLPEYVIFPGGTFNYSLVYFEPILWTGQTKQIRNCWILSPIVILVLEADTHRRMNLQKYVR